jgi:hypothetical protein
MDEGARPARRDLPALQRLGLHQISEPHEENEGVPELRPVHELHARQHTRAGRICGCMLACG